MTESAVVNEILEQGRMQEAREALLRVIRLRFPEMLTPDVERTIADQPNYPLMKIWFNTVCDPTKSADDFLALLRR